MSARILSNLKGPVTMTLFALIFVCFYLRLNYIVKMNELKEKAHRMLNEAFEKFKKEFYIQQKQNPKEWRHKGRHRESIFIESSHHRHKKGDQKKPAENHTVVTEKSTSKQETPIAN